MNKWVTDAQSTGTNNDVTELERKRQEDSPCIVSPIKTQNNLDSKFHDNIAYAEYTIL